VDFSYHNRNKNHFPAYSWQRPDRPHTSAPCWNLFCEKKTGFLNREIPNSN
jgi:hypothetical protein